MDTSDQVTLKLVESILKPGTWKVWIKEPHNQGFLRLGFAWRTRGGAERAALAMYPRGNFIS